MLPHVNTHHLHLLLCMLFINRKSRPFYIKLSTLFAGTPVRKKKQIAEKYLEGERLREEKVLLEKEMTGFLQLYKDTIIPGITSRIDSLTVALNGN